MLREFIRDIRRNSFLPCMHSANRFKKLLMHMALEDIRTRASSESAQHLHVARVSRQHNDPSLREFAKNAIDSLNSIQSGHLNIHQRHIRTMQSKLLDGFFSVRSL